MITNETRQEEEERHNGEEDAVGMEDSGTKTTLLVIPSSPDNTRHPNSPTTKLNVKKIQFLPRGRHAPPEGSVSVSGRFLWEDNDPLSPPESSSRSISFSQLRRGRGRGHSGNGCRDERSLLDHDLYFNDGRFISIEPSRSLSLSMSNDSLPFIGSDGDSTYSSANIAPRAMANYDRQDIFRRSPLIEPTISRRKWAIIITAVLAALGASATMWRGSRSNDSALSTTFAEDDIPMGGQNRRESEIKKYLIQKNVTLGELLMDEDTPQSSALEWVSKYDPLELDPSCDEIVGRYALAVFYFSAAAWHVEQDVPNPYKQTWLSYQAVCHWKGVICDESDRDEEDKTSNVVGIHFSSDDGSIDGPLVRELFVAFQGMRRIRCAGVHLNGILPSEIGLLAGLQVLSLGGNLLSGPLPNELGELSSLELLGLYENMFSSTIPGSIGRLTRLSALYLDNNELTGTIPETIKNLKRLLDFRVRDNKLSGPLPASLGDLAKLQILELDTNQFSGSLPRQLKDLTQLRSLQIHDNAFSLSLPRHLSNQIIFITADSNNLTGGIPTDFANMSNLKQLTLTGNELSGTVSDEICKLVFGGLRLEVDCEELYCDCCSSCDAQ